MAAAATARQAAPVAVPATRRAPARRPPARRRAPARPAPIRRAPLAALPQAAARGAGAVRDFSDSSLIMRLTRGRGWIAVLCGLLGGIVALNVISLSLSAGSGRLSLAIEEVKTENSALRAQIDERLSSSRVEDAAAGLGMANPDPKQISFLSARDGNVNKLLQLLDGGSLMRQPSQPSSYPTGGATYAPVPTSTSLPSVSSGSGSSGTSSTTGSAPSSSSGTSSSGSSSGSSGSSSTSGTTGGVGL